jgi:hypothetical protein
VRRQRGAPASQPGLYRSDPRTGLSSDLVDRQVAYVIQDQRAALFGWYPPQRLGEGDAARRQAPAWPPAPSAGGRGERAASGRTLSATPATRIQASRPCFLSILPRRAEARVKASCDELALFFAIL